MTLVNEVNIGPGKLHRTQQSIPAAYKRPRLYRILLFQSLMAVMLIAASLVAAGREAAFAALTGCVVGIVPNLYFAWRMFLVSNVSHARIITRSLYTAEAGKFGLTVALFALVFATVPPSNPALFFCAYVATSFVHWLAPWLMHGRSLPRN
ncbi:ATP synthase subunit I [Halomonas sp. FL8]|nr:ATP synthase subunit I [Halomonas sp. FL8]MCP1342567.1 ATP synthase subunit I [Halomonas sp. FL8]MCP1366250.1 ATP synthase subunit I [Halomonas sp. BBD48]